MPSPLLLVWLWQIGSTPSRYFTGRFDENNEWQLEHR